MVSVAVVILNGKQFRQTGKSKADVCVQNIGRKKCSATLSLCNNDSTDRSADPAEKHSCVNV
jgi:hypothetical protein